MKGTKLISEEKKEFKTYLWRFLEFRHRESVGNTKSLKFLNIYFIISTTTKTEKNKEYCTILTFSIYI